MTPLRISSSLGVRTSPRAAKSGHVLADGDAKSQDERPKISWRVGSAPACKSLCAILPFSCMAATCNAVVCVPVLRTFTSQPASTRSRTMGSKSQVTAAHSGLVPSASSASKSVSSMLTRNSTMLCCPVAQADASEACVWIISPSVRRGVGPGLRPRAASRRSNKLQLGVDVERTWFRLSPNCLGHTVIRQVSK